MGWHRVAETAYPNQDGARNLPMMGYIHGFAATSPTRAFLGLYGDSLLMTTDGGQTWDCAVAPQGADEEIGI